MARRFGSAMISKADSTFCVYPKLYIRVKVYTAGFQVGDAGVRYLRGSLRPRSSGRGRVPQVRVLTRFLKPFCTYTLSEAIMAVTISASTRYPSASNGPRVAFRKRSTRSLSSR